MDATPNHFGLADPASSMPSGGEGAYWADGMAGMRWAALQDAAAAVAVLAGIAPQPLPACLRDLPLRLPRLSGWRRRAIEQGIEDLAAIMEPGIAALLAVRGGGGNPAVPALALWREFEQARDTLAILLPPETHRN